MKRHIFFYLLPLFLLSACGLGKPKAVGPEDFTLRFHGVNLSLDQAMDTVPILKDASKKEKREFLGSFDTIWTFADGFLSSDKWNNDGSLKGLKLDAIQGKKTGIETKRGIKIGDKIEKVIALYGQTEPASEFQDVWLEYTYTLSGSRKNNTQVEYSLWFTYKDGIVVEIYAFKYASGQ